MAVRISIGLLVLTSFLTELGCSPSLPPGENLALGTIKQEFVTREAVGRSAWPVPGGTRKIVELSLPSATAGMPSRTALRLGLLPANRLRAKVSVDVYVGTKQITSFVVEDTTKWNDQRIPLDPAALSKDKCTVSFLSDRDFWVAPCEITSDIPSSPNVLIVLMDALRADHLGCYGYSRPTSPRIDDFARDSIQCMNAISQSSWTRPAVSTLLTGCYPATHGAVDRSLVLRPGLPRLAQLLDAVGYETHAIMTNPLCIPLWGIGSEFDQCTDLVGPSADRNGLVQETALKWLRYAADRPWFLYLHFMETHAPYITPSPYNTYFDTPGADDFRKWVDDYDETILYSDMQMGRIIDELRTLGLYDNTLIILMADHGEQLGEHGAVNHGESLHKEEVRIPLIVKMPHSDHASVRYEGLIELIDIPSTILEVVGAPPEPRFQGSSILPRILNREPAKVFAYASLQLEGKCMHMAQTAEAKYIQDLVAQKEMWFDLKQDPGEQQPLSQPNPDMPNLKQRLTENIARVTQGLNILITPGMDNIEQLTGSISGKGIANPALQYHQECCEMRTEPDRLSFSIQFGQSRRTYIGSEEWFDKIEQDSARLHADLPPDAEVTLDLQIDGKTVPLSDVFLADPTGVHPAGALTFKPTPVAEPPQSLEPLLLPKRFAVYVWYIPAPGEIQDEQLPAQVREALQGLGYLK